MAEVIASLTAVIGADISGFQKGLKTVKSGMAGLADNLSDVGASMVKLGAPLAAGFTVAIKSAVEFDSVMHNIAAVTGMTGPKLDAMNKEIREIGLNSRYGATAAATAFYDIAGGVTDASVRMAVLKAAVATAQAGQADLGTTTQALISIMNGYGFAAKDATFASDVLTRSVGMGVGTMDEFAGAFPMVTGMAKASGVKLDDLASSLAFITTKGNSASEAATQLSGMMTAILKPNADMEKALKKLGFASGQAAIKNLGLVGTYKALLRAGYGDDMASLTGRVEAFRGVIALTGDDFEKFNKEFKGGIAGATAGAQGIQMGSAAVQIDLLKAQLEDLSITIGNALLPGLTNLMKEIRPIIGAFAEWAKANPEVIATIAKIAVGITGAGGLLIAVSSLAGAIGNLGMAFIGLAKFLIPLIPPLLIIGGLIGAYETNFMGFRDTIDKIGKAIKSLTADQWIGIGALILYGKAIIGLASHVAVGAFGGVLTGIAAAIGKITLAIGLILGPLLLIGGLVAAYITNFAGFRDRVEDLARAFRNLNRDIRSLPTLITNDAFQFGQGLFGAGGEGTNTATKALEQIIVSEQLRKPKTGSGRPGGVIMDSGGSVRAGQSVLVGTGAQPELFRPSSAGTMHPAGSYGMGPRMLTVNLIADGLVEKIILDLAEATRGG